MFRYFIFILTILTCSIYAQNWLPLTQQEKAPPFVTLQQSSNSAVSFHLQISGMSTVKKTIDQKKYTKLSIPDGEHMQEQGLPQIPIITKLIAIPDCDDVILSITESGRRELSNYYIPPVPEYEDQSWPDGSRRRKTVFNKDSAVYASDTEFPGIYGEIIETGYVREQKVARIAIYPVQFNPVRQNISVCTDFQIDVSFVNPTSSVNKELGIFRNMMHHAALNYELSGISASTKSDDIFPEHGLGKTSAGSVTRVTDLDLLSDADPMPVDYLIITHSTLFNDTSLTALANHRRDLNGYDVAIVHVDDIDSANDDCVYDFFPSTNNYESIHDFIKDVYDDGTADHTMDGHLGYVLLVGDAWKDDHTTEMIPAATPSTYGTLEQGGDYYYVCTDSDDYLDLMYGRLSVGNPTQLGYIVDKIKDYELNSSSVWNDEITFISGSYDLFDYSDPDIETMTELLPPPNTKKHYAFMAETGDATGVTEANPIYGQLFTSAQYADPSENCGAANLDSWLYDNTDAGINNGIHTFIYEGHGRWGGLRANEGTGRVIFRADQVDTELDNSLYTFMIFNCCLSGYFDRQTADFSSVDCIAEIVTNLEDKGAIGCLASTRDSDTGAFGTVDRYTLEAQFRHMSHLMGEAVMESKLRVSRKYRRQYNLYGDPAVNLWPEGFTISEDLTLSDTVYISTNLTVNSGVTLTIEEDAVLQFATKTGSDRIKIIVEGELKADGATFESVDDTKGGWQGIYFEDGCDADSYLNTCLVEDAYYGVHTYESITVDSTEFNNIDFAAIKVLDECEPTVTDCKMEADAVGIYIYRGSGTYQYIDFEGPFTTGCVYALGSDNTDYRYCKFDLTGSTNGTYNKYTTSIDVDYADMSVPAANRYYMKEISSGPNSSIYYSYLGCTAANVDSNDFYGDIDWDINYISSTPNNTGARWKTTVGNDFRTARDLMRAKDYQGAYDMLMDLAADSKTDNKSECFQLAMQASKKMHTFKNQESVINDFLGNADKDVQDAAEVWLSIYYEHINDFTKAQNILDNTKLTGEYKLSMLFNLAAAYDDADYDDKALVIFQQIINEFPEEEKEILDIIREMHNGSNNSDRELNKPATESIVPEYFTTAYPNPFNASTTIAYNVPNTGHVRICIYDILGREVKTLVDDVIEQGQNTITWNGANDQNMPVATGVYFYRVQVEDHILTNKILMLR